MSRVEWKGNDDDSCWCSFFLSNFPIEFYSLGYSPYQLIMSHMSIGMKKPVENANILVLCIEPRRQNGWHKIYIMSIHFFLLFLFYTQLFVFSFDLNRWSLMLTMIKLLVVGSYEYFCPTWFYTGLNHKNGNLASHFLILIWYSQPVNPVGFLFYEPMWN